MTGREAANGAELRVQVHGVNSVALPTRRNPTAPVLLVQYACTTPEGVRIDATQFINTETPNAATLEFFRRRALAVKLPSPARSLQWQVKGSRQPTRLTVRKAGRYWNVLEEHFEDNNV